MCMHCYALFSDEFLLTWFTRVTSGVAFGVVCLLVWRGNYNSNKFALKFLVLGGTCFISNI